MHLAAHAARAHENDALASMWMLISKLHGDATAERMADDRHSIDVEHAEEVAHRVRVAAHRVVRAWLIGAAVPEQIRRDDAMVLRQLWDQMLESIRAVADSVDEQERRSGADVDERTPIAVNHSILNCDVDPCSSTRGVAPTAHR